MATVGVQLGGEEPDALAEALAREGFTRDDATPEVRVVSASAIEPEQVAPFVSFVVAGGCLVVAGGEGPLLPALHLSIDEAPVEGALEPAHVGLTPLPSAEALPVTGVGYALYRIGGRCVALAGPRGEGWVGCVGRPDPALVLAWLGWFSRGPGARSQS